MKKTTRVLILLLPAAALAAGCATPAPSTSTPIAPSPANPPATPVGDGLNAGAGTECLVNDNGIQAKVLVVAEGTRCLDRAPDGELVGTPLAYFRPYFLFDTYPHGGPASFYLLGATAQKASVVGWAPAAAVVRWDTRVGVRPVRDPGRRVPPLVVYRDKEALVELLRTGSTAQEPIARGRLTGPRTYMAWPVGHVERVEAGGAIHEAVLIHFLGEVRADLQAAEPADGGGPGDDPAYRQQVRRGVRTLDLVFVIDVTGSMQPYIDAARQAARTISEQLQKAGDFQPEVHFGLVAYRDHDDAGTTFVTRHFDLESDHAAFLARIAALDAGGGGDAPEALYDGLHDALARTSWHALAQKVIVVIADSSAHEPGDRQNPKGISRDALVEMANAGGKKVKIFGLTTGPAERNPDTRTLWEQLTDLGRRTRGECFPLKDAGEVVERVRRIMATETVEVAVKARVVDAVGAGKTTAEDIARDTGLDIRKVTEVLEFLPGAGVELKRLRPGVPTFSSGWVLCEQNGLQVLDREVYLARDEVHVLLAGMNGLLAATSNPEQALEIFGAGVHGRTNPFAAFFARRGPEPLDIFLQAQGIAVGRTSVLRFTAEEVRTMTEDRRALLRERLRGQIIPQLTNASTDRDLWRSRSGVEYGWVPESYLP
jgi:Mg-chelatase subunit ChlD